MAYPFSAMPSLREFVDKACSCGITHGTAKQTAVGPKGEITFRFIRRGNGPVVILPDIEDDQQLTPVQVSSLCRQLDIDPVPLGLTLGFLKDPIGLWNDD